MAKKKPALEARPGHPIASLGPPGWTPGEATFNIFKHLGVFNLYDLRVDTRDPETKQCRCFSYRRPVEGEPDRGPAKQAYHSGIKYGPFDDINDAIAEATRLSALEPDRSKLSPKCLGLE